MNHYYVIPSHALTTSTAADTALFGDTLVADVARHVQQSLRE